MVHEERMRKLSLYDYERLVLSTRLEGIFVICVLFKRTNLRLWGPPLTATS